MDAAPEEFFKDIDRRRQNRGCCTCRSLAIGFVALGVILGVVGALVVKKILAPPQEIKKVEPVGVTAQDVANRFKAAAEQGAQEQEIRVALTSAELTGLLINSKGEVGLDELQALVTPNEVIISGILTRPVRTHLTIHTYPTVMAEGKLLVKLTSVEAGTFKAPQFAVKRVSSVIEKELSDAFTGHPGLGLKEVVLGEDLLTLVFVPTPTAPATPSP